MPGGASSGLKWETYEYFGVPQNASSRSIFSNGEQQVYSDPSYYGFANPFSQDLGAGTWTITATAIPAGTPATDKIQYGDGSTYGPRKYFSGALTTRKSYNATYGLWEVRMRNPTAGTVGTWPALCLYPTVKTAFNFGQVPEVDITEQWGNRRFGSDTSKVKSYSTLHIRKADGSLPLGTQLVPQDTVGIDNGWHTYGEMITATTITTLLDGVVIGEVANPSDGGVVEDHYLSIVLGTGGSTVNGVPNDTIPAGSLPTSMDFQFVRHWPLATVH